MPSESGPKISVSDINVQHLCHCKTLILLFGLGKTSFNIMSLEGMSMINWLDMHYILLNNENTPGHKPIISRI